MREGCGVMWARSSASARAVALPCMTLTTHTHTQSTVRTKYTHTPTSGVKVASPEGPISVLLLLPLVLDPLQLRCGPGARRLLRGGGSEGAEDIINAHIDSGVSQGRDQVLRSLRR